MGFSLGEVLHHCHQDAKSYFNLFKSMKCLFSSSSKQKKPRRAGEQFKMGQGLRVWCPFVAFCEVGKLPNARSLLSLMDVQTSPEPHPCQPVKGSNPVSGNYHVGLTGDVYK